MSKKGLLFAGTNRTVYVSFDDGEDWQPLTINFPSTTVRDMLVHDNDLVVCTQGRGIWALDDVEPLRELTRFQPDVPGVVEIRRSPSISSGRCNRESVPTRTKIRHGLLRPHSDIILRRRNHRLLA